MTPRPTLTTKRLVLRPFKMYDANDVEPKPLLEKMKHGKIQILHLNEKPNYIKTIARWLYDEWGHLRPGSSLESALERIKKRVEGKDIPSIFVAEIEGEAVGTVSLIEHDLEPRKNLSPWVASLFVHNEYRHQEIGRSLMRFIESFAKDVGVERIYLYTPTKQEMYERLGWVEKEELEYLSRSVTVMTKDLTLERK